MARELIKKKKTSRDISNLIKLLSMQIETQTFFEQIHERACFANNFCGLYGRHNRRINHINWRH